MCDASWALHYAEEGLCVVWYAMPVMNNIWMPMRINRPEQQRLEDNGWLTSSVHKLGSVAAIL